jgi:hypothetical protein
MPEISPLNVITQNKDTRAIPVVQNRIPIPVPPVVHTEFPCYAYYQGAADVAAKTVKTKEALALLGPDWGPFPFTTEKFERTGPEIPGVSFTTEPVGTEFPGYFYNQRAKNVPERIVADPIAAEKLGKDWGPLPFSEERLALLQDLDKKEAELKALAPAAPQAPETKPPETETKPAAGETKPVETKPETAPAETEAPKPEAPRPLPPPILPKIPNGKG